MNQELLRQIPSVDCLIRDLSSSELRISPAVMTREIRKYLRELRGRILQNQACEEVVQGRLDRERLLLFLSRKLQIAAQPAICRALNATGVILHTGLGRAVLPPRALETLCRELKGYSVVEVDRATGERSQRDLALRDLICDLTGAEDATVVNNNAAAVFLVLSTLARGREVIVSRGQLVEIGGSFRIPEVMEESGAALVEVGCTNKVHLHDYASAVTRDTAAIFHAHTSNFKVLGFTSEVPLEDLAKLAREKGVYLIQDAGSGALVDVFPWGLQDEPLISESLARGADIVTFSADKLMGACQAGIIVGKKSLVERIRKHPLARAVRIDKIHLSVLESTLLEYESPERAAEGIPALRMLRMDAGQTKERAEKIAEKLRNSLAGCRIEIAPSCARAGSGAFPIQDIPGYAIFLRSEVAKSLLWSRELRMGSPPLFVRLKDEAIVVDPRTLLPEEDDEAVESIIRAHRACAENGKSPD